MVEPLEETRSELIFATEPILSSLDMSILRGSHHTPLVELDEIEVSDGTLATPPVCLSSPRSKRASFSYARDSRSYIHRQN